MRYNRYNYYYYYYYGDSAYLCALFLLRSLQKLQRNRIILTLGCVVAASALSPLTVFVSVNFGRFGESTRTQDQSICAWQSAMDPVGVSTFSRTRCSVKARNDWC